MEPANHKIIRKFITEEDSLDVISYVDTINERIILNDHHLKHLVGRINGSSYMYDIGKTELTKGITEYQSGGHVMKYDLPEVFNRIIGKISDHIQIPTEHSFLQIVDMNTGGKIGKHYDASVPGFINYKCNISVLADEYDFAIDNQNIHVCQSDMYCFEASLYKHWTPSPFNSRRILLSFGFMIPYESLGRSEDDPRIRLSNRIIKIFQKR